MAKIKIELEMDSNDQADVTAFNNLVGVFGGLPVIIEHKPIATHKVSENIQIDPIQTAITEGTKSGITGENTTGFPTSIPTESDLKALSNDALKDYVKSLGIDFESFEGKNTQAKLIRLVNSHFEGTLENETKDGKAAESETVTETLKDETSTEAQEVSFNDVKLKLGEKVDIGDNRGKIVDKLSELGATKLTNLDPSKFSDFMEFLNSL